ncbi:MAG: hypothetical protein IPO92_04590 [Saprospiraceae bacterium]|nr:hypothetical protein [Saprospiraceae bacterium]
MEKNNHIYLSDLHFENSQWLSELKFWKDEIVTFNHRLGEVVMRYSSQEIRAKIEHFHNQFIVHSEVIDTLKKSIKQNEKEIANFAAAHTIAVDHVHFKDHTGLREEMETQRSIYGELKNEYFKFLSKTM